jgi:hypothetical protein
MGFLAGRDRRAEKSEGSRPTEVISRCALAQFAVPVDLDACPVLSWKKHCYIKDLSSAVARKALLGEAMQQASAYGRVNLF